MYLYIELWKPQPAWHALSTEERSQYMATIGPSLQQLVDDGLELVGFGLNEEETPNRADYRYVAVWRVKNRKTALLLENVVREAGWHDYFEQVNVRGRELSLIAALNDMVALTDEVSDPVEIPTRFE